MRPGEAFALRWQHILSKDGNQTGMIQVVEGKSKAARRILPMTPTVYRILKARREAAENPTAGWIFPSASREGHLTVDGITRAQGTAQKSSKIQALRNSRRIRCTVLP